MQNAKVISFRSVFFAPCPSIERGHSLPLSLLSSKNFLTALRNLKILKFIFSFLSGKNPVFGSLFVVFFRRYMMALDKDFCVIHVQLKKILEVENGFECLANVSILYVLLPAENNTLKCS